MPRKISVHIGLNALNDDIYDNRLINGKQPYPPLNCSVKNALKMQEIAVANGFQSGNEQLFTFDGNVVETDLDRLKAKHILNTLAGYNYLEKGDSLLITYSGHGSQFTGYETGGRDQAWCFYDRPVLDDELTVLKNKFAAGVNIIFVSNSCHSGTMIDFPKIGITPNMAEMLKNNYNFDFGIFESAVLKAKGITSANLINDESLQNALKILNEKVIEIMRKKNLKLFNREELRSNALSFFTNTSKGKLDKLSIQYFKNVTLGFGSIVVALFFSFLPQEKIRDFFQITPDTLGQIPLLENTKSMSRDLMTYIYLNNPEVKNIWNSARTEATTIRLNDSIQANTILLSACEDDQITYDGCVNDLLDNYTKAIWESTDTGKFKPEETYNSLQTKLEEKFTVPGVDCKGNPKLKQHPQLTPKIGALTAKKIFQS